MQKIFPLIIVYILFIGLGCKQKKDVAGSPETESAIADTSKPADLIPEKSRLVVVFFSIADGVDTKSLLRFEDSIGEFAGELGINIDYEKTHWGREGETDFCLELTELSDEQQAQFIHKTKELLTDAKHYKIYENEPCRHRKVR